MSKYGGNYSNYIPQHSHAPNRSYDLDEPLVNRVSDLRQQLLEERRRAARFEADCKEMAAQQKGHLRRGHLVVNGEMLLEHWWSTEGDRVHDMALMDVRGHHRTSKNLTLEYLPIDPEGTFFDGEPWTGCMKTWGACSLHPAECDWCKARHAIVKKRPTVRPGRIVVGFESLPTAESLNLWDHLRES